MLRGSPTGNSDRPDGDVAVDPLTEIAGRKAGSP